MQQRHCEQLSNLTKPKVELFFHEILNYDLFYRGKGQDQSVQVPPHLREGDEDDRCIARIRIANIVRICRLCYASLWRIKFDLCPLPPSFYEAIAPSYVLGPN